MRSPVAALLKSRTAQTHAQVEARLGLLDGPLTPQRLRAVIERFAGFWPVAERGVTDWAARNPEAAAALSWTRRRRSGILRADLLALGLTGLELAQLPEVSPVFAATPDHADVLGWLYVAEGSTLGGAVIDRALRESAGPRLPRVATFTPYAEGPGPMWRAYLAFLAEWVGEDDTRAEAVAGSAQRSFAALADWLEPLRDEVAA